MFLFYRCRTVPHPFDAALTALAGSSDENTAFAQNLRFDHRVSEERENALQAYVGTPASAAEFARRYTDYCELQIRSSPTPEFLNDILNRLNIISPPPPENEPSIKDDRMLVTVLDLNGLRRVFQWAKSEDIPEWRNFLDKFDPVDDDTVLKWLDDQLLGKADKVQRDFVATVFRILNSNRYRHDVGPYNPSWVTYWRHFWAAARNKPERWAELVGVYRDTPRWLVLLTYTVKESGGLVRPTQIDAASYPYHYPSCPHVHVTQGGVAMDLAAAAPADPPLFEFIHEQKTFDIKDLYKIDRTRNSRRHAAIPALRRRHKELLGKHFSPPADWMP